MKKQNLNGLLKVIGIQTLFYALFFQRKIEHKALPVVSSYISSVQCSVQFSHLGDQIGHSKCNKKG